MSGLDKLYYRLALRRADERDLTGAINYASFSLKINPENEGAKKLLEICLRETGRPCSSKTAQKSAEGHSDEHKKLGRIIRPLGEKTQGRALFRVLGPCRKYAAFRTQR